MLREQLEAIARRLSAQAGNAEERWEASDRTDKQAERDVMRYTEAQTLIERAIDLLAQR